MHFSGFLFNFFANFIIEGAISLRKKIIELKKDVEEAGIQYELTDEDLIDSVIQDFFEEESA